MTETYSASPSIRQADAILRTHATNPLQDIVAWLVQYVPEIEILALAMTGRIGYIPPEIGQLTRLEVIDLATNHLTGSLPAELGDLPNLHTLRLSGNRFTGAIPERLAECKQLQFVYVSDNRFSGHIPPAIGELPNLHSFSCYGNDGLTGELPTGIQAKIADGSMRVCVSGTQLAVPAGLWLKNAIWLSERLARAGVQPADIAAALNLAGHVTAEGRPWDIETVKASWSFPTRHRMEEAGHE